MSATMAANNAQVKKALERVNKIVETSPISDYDFIFNHLCKDFIKGYVIEFDHTIKQIQKKIDAYIETKYLKMSMDTNKCFRAALVYIWNGKEKKAQKYLSKFFNHSIQMLELMNEKTIKVKAFNSEDATEETFKVKNSSEQMLIQSKYKMDYEMATIFYLTKFKKAFEMIEVKEDTKLSLEEELNDLLDWRTKMMSVHKSIELYKWAKNIVSVHKQIKEEDVDISCIEDELDNALFQENMDWCYKKPKSGKYETIYIFKRQKEE